MKIFVDFLGFDSSYRQEIIVDENTFNVAEISLEDFKSKFSDITFQCKKSEIFKFYQRAENNIYTLQKGVTSSTTTFYINDDSISNDTLLWIGNERIRIIQKNLDGTYGVERGYNNSISVSHFFDEQVFDKTGVVLLSEKKITIQNTIIRFVKTNNIKQNEEILGYFSIDEVISKNNKTVEITAKPIFDLFSDKTLIKFSTNQTLTNSFNFKYFLNLIQTSKEIYSNEFLRLFMLSENINNAFECFVEFDENSSEYATINFKKIFETYLNFNNAILYFDSTLNRYTTTRTDKLVSTESITDIYLFDYININSKIECEMIQKVSQISVKTKLNAINEAGIQSFNEYVDREITLIDYDLATVTSEKLELDMTSINVIDESTVMSIAKNKILQYNNMNEKITLNCPKWFDFFKVGQTYNVKDCHKIDTFTNQSTNNYFKCYSKENDTVKFIYIATAVRYIVAPSIPMTVEDGNNTILIPKYEGNTQLSDYTYSDTTDLSAIKIIKTDKSIFEIDDVIKLSNYVTQSDIEVTIVDVGDDYIEVDTTLTASNYVVTFPDLSTVSNKYSYFIYSDVGEI